MYSFEARAGEFLRTIRGVHQIRGGPIATLLRSASAQLLKTGWDNWNGGTDLYTFEITVPTKEFAETEPIQDEVEKALLESVRKLVRTETDLSITDVVLRPAAPSEDGEDLPGDDPGNWDPGYFRLFISHHSTHKRGAVQLRDALERYLISGFVAHVDIEPTREWESQIEAALRTLDALVAVITPEFLTSKWCDQEVGFAMGRQKLVVPLRAGADPHGFLGKFQGLQAKGIPADDLADQIFDILARHENSRRRIAETAVSALLDINSWEGARATMDLIDRIPQIDRDLLERLRDNWESNLKIVESYTVPDRIKRVLLDLPG